MRLITVLFATAALAGCTVGPNFERPAQPSAKTYLPLAENGQGAAGQPQPDLGMGPAAQWWTIFGSAELNATVERAIANNRSLAASNATLTAARQELRAVAGRQQPQVDVSTRADQEQVNLSSFGFSGGGFGLNSNPNFELYSVGGGISYDLDLFGGLRRQVEQTAAQGEAQLRQTQAAHLALAGQVVSQVFMIAAIRAQIATTQTILDEDARNVDLTQKRRTAGEGTLVEVLTAQGQYTADRTLMPPLDQQLAEARHMLAVLSGVAPADLGATEFELGTLTLPVSVPVALPSELVHRRPDILQAEANLHAATAAIGVATARLYPDITIGASLTQAAPALGKIFGNESRGYDIFAGLSAPIFHGGTLKAQRAAAMARAHAADATYQQTVLEAFGQIADLLSAIQTDARSVDTQHEALTVAQHSLQLSRRSFQVGNSGILQILDSERLVQRASASLVNARAQQYLNVARLYVATAGGWS